MNKNDYLRKFQKSTLPGIWSKGVALARDHRVHPEKESETEFIFRVSTLETISAPQVTLWPHDDDYYCDCGSQTEPCAHVAAAVIFWTTPQEASSAADAADQKADQKADQRAVPKTVHRIEYHFTRKDGSLHFERKVNLNCELSSLSGSLTAYLGGIRSHRIPLPDLAVSKTELQLDQILGNKASGVFDAVHLSRIFSLLAECQNVFFDGERIQTSGVKSLLRVILEDEKDGFRLRGQEDSSVLESFRNSAVLCHREGHREGRREGDVSILRPAELLRLDAGERALLSEIGQFFRRDQGWILISEVLPELRRKFNLEVRTERLPELADLEPRIEIRTESPDPAQLQIVADIVYGDPPLARVQEGQLELLSERQFPIRDLGTEQQLIRKLQLELHMSPGQLLSLSGKDALEFARLLQSWKTKGNGLENFRTEGQLAPVFEFRNGALEVLFSLPSSSASSVAGKKTVAWRQVLEAYVSGEPLIPLSGGGWARLPSEWLVQNLDRIRRIFLLQEKNGGKAPGYALPEIARLFCETTQNTPEVLQSLIRQLESPGKISSAPIPAHLEKILRPYQIDGIRWLHFLREIGAGALLADDMGLGKTIQALCLIRGRTLILTPTSVLSSWKTQLEEYFPELSFCLYHGPGRKYDPQATVLLTSHALARIELERFQKIDWDMIIVDEAQSMKNPQSQLARAVYKLPGKFRVALSGTPVENKLDDLWSQFQFLNPGLLGSLEEFGENFSTPISHGDGVRAVRLKNLIQPFILRRLKRNVASELPERIETVLQCEFSEDERNLYDSILATGRKEVIAKLEAGESPFCALELLLRLRQACCHPALIAGERAYSSAKTELLVERLLLARDAGHACLVFSQWTSYLDLIEPHLRSNGLSYLRLDGSTSNRAELIERFQASDGPPVFLISLKAGGLGLNLTRADQVYILDPWWNPAVEEQAADRAHRIGQKNPVLIHKIIAPGTLEERVLVLQKKKKNLSESILDEKVLASRLSREEILDLLRQN